MKRGFVVIEDLDNSLYTHGLWPDLYSAIGCAMCHMKDDEDDMVQNNGYEISEKDDFWEITDGSEGYGWSRTYIRKDENGEVKSTTKSTWMVIETRYDFQEGEDD